MQRQANVPGRAPLGLRLHGFLAQLRLAVVRALSGDVRRQVG